MPKEEEKKATIPEKFKDLIEKIENLKVSELAELVKILEDRLGVVPVPQAVPVAPGAPAPGAEKVPEKKVLTVTLKAMGEKKIEVIKAVRDIMGKGLKAAKDLVDAVAEGPQVVKENVKREEAQEIKKKLEKAGATVELK